VPTRKQRRRREKDRRHNYEYVYVDEEGREVEVAPDDVPNEKRRNGDARPAAVGRGGRKIEPPSWSRVGKRALWIGPLMFLALTLLGGSGLGWAQRLSQTMLMLALFLPVSYFMDRTIYRASVRRKSPPR
jgi:hypothetical protein